MGMAAGQARLLSITTRMSDNELRAQIINNNKLRLATDSSKASEAYIQALNDAQLMFSNYDANNNATYQQLTFNALTAYNPYNNQYALSNASGNVLISEYDARNYESVRMYSSSEDRLAAFLSCYGLEYTTNYFDETLGAACLGNCNADGKYLDSDEKPLNTDPKEVPVYLPLYNENGTLELGKGNDDAYYGLKWNTGLKVDQLKAMYEGGSTIILNENQTIKCNGYMYTLQSAVYYDYQSALNDYLIKKEDYEGFVAVAKEPKLDEIVKDAFSSSSLEMPDGSKISSMDDLIDYVKAIPATDSTGNLILSKNDTEIDDIWNEIMNMGGNMNMGVNYVNLLHTSQREWYDQLKTETTQKIGDTYIETLEKDDFVYANTQGDGSGNWYILLKEGNDYVPYACLEKDNNNTITNLNIIRNYTPTDAAGNDGSPFYIIPGQNSVPADLPVDKYSIVNNNNNSTIRPMELPSGNSNVTKTFSAAKECTVNSNGDITSAVQGTDLTLYMFDGGSDILYNAPNTVEDEKNALLTFLRTLQTSIKDKWDSSSFKGDENQSAAAEGTPGWAQYQLYLKYNAYEEAAIKLGEFIYGKNTYSQTDNNGVVTLQTNVPLPIDKLGDFLKNAYYKDTNTDLALKDEDDNPIKEKSGADFDWNALTDEFKNVLQVLILDEVMSSYGEPKFAYIDKNNPDENGDVKAQWYTNLFNRIEDGGYRTLKDGLASSPEWIKFAFESGIITLEQVDDKYTWNKMIYTNSADITEQTDSVAVAKAEAEYNAAMNKIENKDKRYDMELKNIDTEHNSLQTEYDSIKTAIDKNIERTFKLYI